MNDDMLWVNLTQEEVEELRSKKQELTQYGKDKIRELMNDGKLRVYDEKTQKYTIIDDGSSWGKTQTPEMKLEVKEMTHKVRFINIKYTDVFEKDQVLTVKEMIPYAWHENFTFEEVEGEYHTIFFEDVK